MAMQRPLFRMSRDEATIAFTGRAHGADTDAVLCEIARPIDTHPFHSRTDSTLPLLKWCLLL